MVSAHCNTTSDSPPNTRPLLRAPHCGHLYTSHFLSTWNSRVFEFSAILFIASIFPDTLLPSSLYALVRAGSAIVFAAVVGQYIDSHDRLEVARFSIIGQRVAVIGSCIGFWSLGRESGPWWRSGILCFVAILACVEKLCAIMNMVAIEKDWVVTIAKDNKSRLQQLNSKMRRIDLACKLIGPLAISMVDGFSATVAIWTVLGLNVISVVVEYPMIAKVYWTTPDLQIRPEASQRNSASQRNRVFRSMRTYISHPSFHPSLSLSLLYFTVLSFNGQMITYLLSTGYSSSTIGYLRTVSAVSEISATWLAPLLMSRIGAIRGGLWFINWQALCVVGAAVCFWTGIQPVHVLIIGVIGSRAGLWGFDLCVQTIIQEEVEDGTRGGFSSVESSLQNTFELLSYASTIVFARPAQFRVPVVLTAAAVSASGALYAGFVRQRRGHLLHSSRCVEWKDDEEEDNTVV